MSISDFDIHYLLWSFDRTSLPGALSALGTRGICGVYPNLEIAATYLAGFRGLRKVPKLTGTVGILEDVLEFASPMRIPDLAIVALYLVGITLFGARFRRRQKTLKPKVPVESEDLNSELFPYLGGRRTGFPAAFLHDAWVPRGLR